MVFVGEDVLTSGHEDVLTWGRCDWTPIQTNIAFFPSRSSGFQLTPSLCKIGLNYKHKNKTGNIHMKLAVIHECGLLKDLYILWPAAMAMAMPSALTASFTFQLWKTHTIAFITNFPMHGNKFLYYGQVLWEYRINWLTSYQELLWTVNSCVNIRAASLHCKGEM